MGFVIGRGRNARETYPQSPGAAGGGGGALTAAPYTDTAFVDLGTAVPLAQQNGSCLAPFATIQQAVDAHTTDGVVYVYLFGPSQDPGVVLPDNFELTVRSMEPRGAIAAIVMGTGSQVLLEDCFATSISGSGAQVEMSLTQARTVSDEVTSINVPGSNVRLRNVGLFSGASPTCITAADVYLDGCTSNFSDVAVCADCATFVALNTRFLGGAGTTVRSSIVSTFKGCEFQGGNVTVDNTGSTPAEFDDYSNYRFKNAVGCSVLNPGKVVIADLVA